MFFKKDFVIVSIILLFFFGMIAGVIAYFRMKEQKIEEKLDRMHSQL